MLPGVHSILCHWFQIETPPKGLESESVQRKSMVSASHSIPRCSRMRGASYIDRMTDGDLYVRCLFAVYNCEFSELKCDFFSEFQSGVKYCRQTQANVTLDYTYNKVSFITS